MRKLIRDARPYVLSTEWGRLHPEYLARQKAAEEAGEAAPPGPTVWHIKSLSGADVLRWQCLIEEESRPSETPMWTPQQRAQRRTEIELDKVVSALTRIENYNFGTEDVTDYRDTTDDAEKRRALADLEIHEWNELCGVIQDSERLSVGEPARLRSVLTTSSGGARNRDASGTTSAGSVSGQATTSTEAAFATDLASG